MTETQTATRPPLPRRPRPRLHAAHRHRRRGLAVRPARAQGDRVLLPGRDDRRAAPSRPATSPTRSTRCRARATRSSASRPTSPPSWRSSASATHLTITLASDEDRSVMTSYGAFGEKKLYGKTVAGRDPLHDRGRRGRQGRPGAVQRQGHRPRRQAPPRPRPRLAEPPRRRQPRARRDGANVPPERRRDGANVLPDARDAERTSRRRCVRGTRAPSRRFPGHERRLGGVRGTRAPSRRVCADTAPSRRDPRLAAARRVVELADTRF